jgi:hypothetical protein
MAAYCLLHLFTLSTLTMASNTKVVAAIQNQSVHWYWFAIHRFFWFHWVLKS